MTTKAEAYKILMAAGREESSNGVEEALACIGAHAGRSSVLFLGQFHGAAWMAGNKGWKQAEYLRAVSVVERCIGRTLSGFRREVVRRAMMAVLDAAA